MSVVNGQQANATVFNGAFMSRTSNTSTVGVVTLNNTSVPASGAQITNAQRYINELAAALGITGEGDASALVYTSNNYLVNGDTRKQSLERLDMAFDIATGHNHDGVNSRPVDALTLTGINQFRADWQVLTVVGAVGSSYDVSTEFAGRFPDGTTTATGVATDPPYNRVEIRDAITETYLEDAGGQRIYGRITETAGVWALDFYTNEAGVETAATIAATDITVSFKEVFNLATLPTFGSDVGFLGTFDLTNDIIYGTELIAGKLLLANSAPPDIAGTGAKGTSVEAAHEDHTHAGVHSLDWLGGGTPILGDVVLEAGSQITLSYSSGRIKIDSSAVAEPTIEYRTISGGEATAKQLTLTGTPLTPAKVLVDFIGGSAQEYAVDYTVSGAVLDWSGLGLDTLPLASGDKLRIVYWA
jgi:hypothetical protein